MENHITHVDGVEEEGDELDDEGRASVARTRDATEKNETRNEQSGAHAQHTQGLDTSRNGGSLVGEDADNGHWENPQDNPQGYDAHHRHESGAFNHRYHRFPSVCAKEIGGESRGSGGESNERDEHKVGDGAHHVGGCQFARAKCSTAMKKMNQVASDKKFCTIVQMEMLSILPRRLHLNLGKRWSAYL